MKTIKNIIEKNLKDLRWQQGIFSLVLAGTLFVVSAGLWNSFGCVKEYYQQIENYKKQGYSEGAARYMILENARKFHKQRKNLEQIWKWKIE
jgi:hypothetical protein